MERSPLRLAVDVVVGASAAAIGTVDAAAGVVAAGTVPVATAATEQAIAYVAKRAERRREVVLAAAAAYGTMPVDDLVRRLHESEPKEQLLLRTLRAAEDAASQEKLVAYAVALATGADTTAEDKVSWETTFVRALDDLDPDHIKLLSRFTFTAAQLGLREPSSEPDPIMTTLNEKQVEMVAGDIANLPAVLAVLQRHGLIASRHAGGRTLGGGSGPVYWSLTAFGQATLDRFREIGELIQRL